MIKTLYQMPKICRKCGVAHVCEDNSKYDPLSLEGLSPGTRVKAFDYRLYKDDKSTPKTITMQVATVVVHYGELAKQYSEDFVLGPYDSLVDLVFDRTPDIISKGHFTWGLELLCRCGNPMSINSLNCCAECITEKKEMMR